MSQINDTLSQIEAKKLELEGLRPIETVLMSKIQQKFRFECNFHSNKIEGNSLTLQETRSLLMFDLVQGQAKRLRDYEEIKGHNKAILYLEEVIKDQKPLSESLIRELNKTLLVEDYYNPAITQNGESTQKMIKVGEYKTQPNHVLTATGEIFHFAEPFEVSAKVYDLLDWYESNKNNLNILRLITNFHHKFILIHPFDDGNGRTCRLLVNLILQNHGYPPIWIPENEREIYYSCLRLADVGNIEPFEEYLGQRLLFSLDLMIRGAKGEDI